MRRARILFATDFSADSDIVREHTVAFARDRHAIVLVAHVRRAPCPVLTVRAPRKPTD